MVYWFLPMEGELASETGLLAPETGKNSSRQSKIEGAGTRILEYNLSRFISRSVRLLKRTNMLRTNRQTNWNYSQWAFNLHMLKNEKRKEIMETCTNKVFWKFYFGSLLQFQKSFFASFLGIPSFWRRHFLISSLLMICIWPKSEDEGNLWSFKMHLKMFTKWLSSVIESYSLFSVPLTIPKSSWDLRKSYLISLALLLWCPSSKK